MEDYYAYHRRVTARKRRGRALIALLAVLAVLCAVAGWFYFNEGAIRADAGPGLPQAEPLAAGEPTSVPTPEEAAPAPTAPPQGQRLLPAVEAALWDTSTPVEQTIDLEYLNTDFRMVSVPMLGTVADSYFDTATFAGDSIMSGLGLYRTGLLNAHYVAAIGASANTFVNNATIKDAVTGVTETPQEAIVATQPDTLYFMCGTNALQQLDTEDALLAYYERMIEIFRGLLDPGVTFYIQAIPGVQEYVVENRPGLYPERLEIVNDMLANLALRTGCYFINTWEVLCDTEGNMRDEYDVNYDGIHLNDTGYGVWADYLRTHTVWSPRNAYVGQNPYYIYGK